MKHVISELRAHLVDAGLVGTPADPNGLPIAWLAPADGTPAPGEGTPASDVVVGIYPAAGFTLGILEQPWMSREAADIYIRTGANNQPAALELARSIRRELVQYMSFDLGELHVQQCSEIRPAQLVGADDGQGATYVMSLQFLVLDESFGA